MDGLTLVVLSHPMATRLAGIHPDPGVWGLRLLGPRQDGLDYAVTQPWKIQAAAEALAVLAPTDRVLGSLLHRLRVATPSACAARRTALWAPRGG